VPTGRIRTDRVVVAVVTGLLVLATLLYYVIERGKLGDTRLATDKTLLAALAATIVVVSLGLAWVMVRNLGQVLAERRGPIGSRLQVRVVLAFLLLVLVPSLFLFVTAITVVHRTLKDLAPPDVSRVLREAARAADTVQARELRRVRHVAMQVAADLARGPGCVPPPEGDGRAVLRELLRRYDLAALGVVSREGAPLVVAVPVRDEGPAARSGELGRIPGDLVREVFGEAAPIVRGERLPYGWRAVAVVPCREAGEIRSAVFAVGWLPERVARQLDAVALNRDEIESIARRRPAVQRLYIALFLLLTVLVLFASVWAGFRIARQVTGPIGELSRATEALAAGDFSWRVSEGGDDEIGRLATSFNRMAEEIQRGRQALDARRRYIEMLLEAIPVGVLSLDGRGKVTLVNARALELLRLERMAPGTPLEVALGEQRRELRDALAPLLAGEVDRVVEEVPLDLPGGRVSLEVTAERFALAADHEGILVVLEDLTSLRRAERTAAWAEVARKVAHEIKNPLTPIRLSAERLLRRFQKDPASAGEVVEEVVATIVREVESLRNLVAEFSRFARLPEVRLQGGDVREVIREALALYRDAHPGITFRPDLAEELPEHRLDREAFRRVLINLLDNAVQAVGRSGEIRVVARSHPGHHSVVVEVIDDGPGIPPEDRRRLFQVNFSRRPGGTGLGLAIVHQLVTEMGGRVRAEEAEGGGTRMIVELPAAPGAPGVSDEASGRGTGGRNDDDCR